MSALGPTPQTTLAILLGASEWPQDSEFQSSKAFATSAKRLQAYLLNPHQLGLPTENFLNLFDADQGSDDIDSAICNFLERRIEEMKAARCGARDLLVYYIGHGAFAGADRDFILTIRRTRRNNRRASSIGIASLSDTLKENARHLRRILILDCCFAGEAFKYFQAGPDQVAIQQTIHAFEVKGEAGEVPGRIPERGTALLCSSGKNNPSLLLEDGSATMFSDAFLRALSSGKKQRPDKKYLSLYELKELTEDVLECLPGNDAPKPFLGSPDQSDGDIAIVPFFPNLAAHHVVATIQETQRGLSPDALKLDELIKRLDRIEHGQQGILRKQLRSWNLQMQQLHKPCPGLFLLTRSQGFAVNSKDWVSRPYRLHLLCQYPAGPHRMKGEPGYEILQGKEWWMEISPWLRCIVEVLQIGMPLGRSLGSIPNPANTNRFADELDVLQEILNDLPVLGAINVARNSRIDLDAPAAQQAQQAALRVLYHRLDNVDPTHWWQGLAQVVTSDGTILWLCDEHRKEFEPSFLRKS